MCIIKTARGVYLVLFMCVFSRADCVGVRTRGLLLWETDSASLSSHDNCSPPPRNWAFSEFPIHVGMSVVLWRSCPGDHGHSFPGSRAEGTIMQQVAWSSGTYDLFLPLLLWCSLSPRCGVYAVGVSPGGGAHPMVSCFLHLYDRARQCRGPSILHSC